MEKFLGKFSPQLYALLRIVVGFLFACHGAQKLFGLLGGTKVELMSQKGLAGVIEFFGGVLILVGFQTGWAAFISSGTMAVAYFQVHQPMGALPIQNRGELAAVYAFLFLFMAAKGDGIWSVGAMLGKKGKVGD